MTEKLNKGIFLDRDGTIIYDKAYLSEPAGVELVPGSAGALARARALGYHLFLFTNQSGISRGYFTHDDVHACNARMLELLGLGEDLFTEVCIAPEHPEDTPVYRKPSPRFIEECIEKYELNREASFMVGDRKSDWQAGLNAEIQAVAVRCGIDWDAASEELIKRESIHVYDTIVEFIESL